MRTALGVFVCSALMVAGCGGDVKGEAAPAGQAAGEPVFSPCDDIPDEAIVAIGMDPATASRDILDVHQPGWNICAWNNDDSSLSVFSSIYTLDDLRSNDDFTDFVPTHVDGRDALVFRNASIPASERSYVATGTGEGMVMVAVSDWAKDPSRPIPADLAPKFMRVLLPHLPQ